MDQVKTGWVLFLDADEYFDPTEIQRLTALLPTLSEETLALSVLRYNFFSSGAFYTSECIKLFRSHPKIRYSGVVVDSVKPALKALEARIEASTILLNHFGHCRPVAVREAKARKYLNMMEEELSQNPHNFRVMGYKALVLRTVGRLDEAEQCSLRALDEAPDEGHPHFARGHVLRALGKHREAIDAYSRAIEIEGETALYLNSRAIACLTLGDLPSAERDLKSAIERFPEHLHFTLNLGLLEQAKGNFSQALQAFQRVAEGHPAFLECRFEGCTEVDPYSGFIYDTIYNFRGLAYHLAYCHARVHGVL